MDGWRTQVLLLHCTRRLWLMCALFAAVAKLARRAQRDPPLFRLLQWQPRRTNNRRSHTIKPQR
jgi:hypothetical protein